jgi:hypothetical protein
VSTKKWQKYIHALHGNAPKFTTHFARAMMKELDSYERAMNEDHRHVPQFLERIIDLAETTLHEWNQPDEFDETEHKSGWKEDAQGDWYYWWQPCEDQWACEDVEGDRFWHTDNTFVNWTETDWKEYVDGSDDDEEDAENGDDEEDDGGESQ